MKNKLVILLLTVAMTVAGFAAPMAVFADTETGDSESVQPATEEPAAEEAAGQETDQADAVVSQDGTDAESSTPATVETPAQQEEQEVPVADPAAEAVKASTIELKGTAIFTSKTAVLTWNKIEEAEGYGVYKLDAATGKYVWLKTIRDNDTVALTVSLTMGQENGFKVFAYRSTDEGNVRTPYSEPVLFDLANVVDAEAEAFKAQTVTLTGTANGTAATLTWNKVPGAEGYGVYKLDPETGKYIWVKTIRSAATTKLSVTLTLDSNNAYSVFAYKPHNGTTIRTAYSDAKEFDLVGITAATLFTKKTIKLYGTMLSNTSARLTWDKIADADGYGLYKYDASQQKYVWCKTLNGASNCSATVALVPGQNNYFKVFAFKKVDGVNVCTGFSAYRRFAPAKATATAVKTLAVANSKKGCSYVYGAAGPSVFDCSGFTMYVMKQSGISLPHNAAAQYNVLASKNIGTDYRKAQPGDLVFYSYGGPSSSHHVGIYYGNGKVIHASSSHGRVVVTDIGFTGGHVAAICRP